MVRSAGFALLFSTMPLAAVTRPAIERAEHAFHDLGKTLGETMSVAVGVPAPVLPAPLPESLAAPASAEPASESPSPDRAKPFKRAKKSRQATRAPDLVVSIDEQRIIELARLRAIPEGRPVPAKGARPAGIALYGVARLGVGLRDGDVLTSVEGRSVQAEGQVIGAVTAVLMRQGRRISAEFWRGDRRGLIVVELPVVRLPP